MDTNHFIKMDRITQRPPVGQVEDLASLPELDEGILLEELRTRYKQNNIYTYVGDILVSVNPFKNNSRSLWECSAV